jgi:hypothetical protein
VVLTSRHPGARVIYPVADFRAGAVLLRAPAEKALPLSDLTFGGAACRGRPYSSRALLARLDALDARALWRNRLRSIIAVSARIQYGPAGPVHYSGLPQAISALPQPDVWLRRLSEALQGGVGHAEHFFGIIEVSGEGDVGEKAPVQSADGEQNGLGLGGAGTTLYSLADRG